MKISITAPIPTTKELEEEFKAAREALKKEEEQQYEESKKTRIAPDFSHLIGKIDEESKVDKEKLPVPLGHLVMVSIPEKEVVSSGGIILTPLKSDIRREEDGSQIGFVHAIGPTAYASLGDGTPWVKVGDKVYFKRYAGVEYRANKDAPLYRIMNDDDIYMIFPADEEIV